MALGLVLRSALISGLLSVFGFSLLGCMGLLGVRPPGTAPAGPTEEETTRTGT